MAARRDRERRRPAADRRYQFGTPQTPLGPEDTQVVDDEQATEMIETPPKRSRGIAAQAAAGPPVRGGVRAAPRPFSAYKAEYTYVFGDLRRVAIVIGSLLVILLLLYFVLPR